MFSVNAFQDKFFERPDPECGCEIKVTKGAEPGKGGDQNPCCCCGKEMKKWENKRNK